MDSSKPYNLLGVLSHQNVQDFVPLDSSWKSFLLTTSPKSEKKKSSNKNPQTHGPLEQQKILHFLSPQVPASKIRASLELTM